MTDVRALYDGLIDAWNRRNADQFAQLFEEDGSIVGYDGTQVDGREGIREHLRAIFADHVTATYVTRVREVRHLDNGVSVLRAMAGLIPPGSTEVNPALNAVQTLIGRERIVLFQNTPTREP